MSGLNAPYGAPCFLTLDIRSVFGRESMPVLMYLMALGAF